MERKSLSASAVLKISPCWLSVAVIADSPSLQTMPESFSVLSISSQWAPILEKYPQNRVRTKCFLFALNLDPSADKNLFFLVTVAGTLVYTVDTANDQMFFFFSAPEWAGSIECSCQLLVHWLYLEWWKRPRRRGRTPTFPILQSECSQLSQIVHIFFFLV